jgi:hypothetical protein
MTKNRSSVIGLFLIWGALWVAACAGTIDYVGDRPTGTGSHPTTLTPIPSPVPPTPTAFPLPTRVSKRLQGGGIVIMPESTEFRGNSPDGERIILKSITELEANPKFQKRLPDREKIAETSHFEFFAEDGYCPMTVDELPGPFERVFEYVSTRLGASLEGKIALSFRRPVAGPCSVRGLAKTWPTPQIYLYADQETSREQLLGVLAHEVGHIVHHYGFAENLSGGSGFDEGLATWAAGQYWNEWHGTPSLQAGVRTYLEAGTYLPLYKHYDVCGAKSETTKADEDCLERRDTLYTEWATLIDYLIEQHGRDKLLDLLRTSSIESTETETIVKPPDYQAVYGRALNQLEAAWLEHITSGD